MECLLEKAKLNTEFSLQKNGELLCIFNMVVEQNMLLTAQLLNQIVSSAVSVICICFMYFLVPKIISAESSQSCTLNHI